MQQVRFLPRFDDGNGWFNILPPPPPPPAREREGDLTADWLVIGAGYAGLSAARTLAGHFPDKHIALVEADRVGRGTAGRNAGFAIDLPFLGEAHSDPARGRRILALHRAGQAELDGWSTNMASGASGAGAANTWWPSAPGPGRCWTGRRNSSRLWVPKAPRFTPGH